MNHLSPWFTHVHQRWRAFLRGVRETADEASSSARKILELRDEHRALIAGEGRAAANLGRIHEHLFRHPYVTIEHLVDAFDLTPAGAGGLVRRLEKLGILVEITGRKRARMFAYRAYQAVFEGPGEAG